MIRKPSLRLRLLNAASRAVQGLGFGSAGFVESADAFHEAAAKASGCGDFGDSAYLEGYRVFLEALDREAQLTPFGRAMQRRQLVAVLVNRLECERRWRDDPTVLETPIERPIFILGLPRAGTTAMHHLLGADPQNQMLEYWLAASPQPRPPRAMWESIPDFKRSHAELAAMYKLDPSLKAVHLMTADGPEECRHLLQQSFTDDTFDCNVSVPTYSEWYAQCDMRPAYARHKKLLQLIGSVDRERRWLLKYPVHMGNLRVLLDQYPDARFVQTHRDPAKVVPSLCSLVAGWRSMSEAEVDGEALGRWQLDLWSRRLIDGIEVRRDCETGRFFDLHFRDVQSDPVDAVRRMYEHFGMEMSEEGERRMRAWRDANPPGKYGEHRYDASDFGLDDAKMNAAFAPYLEHFDVQRE